MYNRVNCMDAGCNVCSKAIFVRKNFWGEKLYSCEKYPKKHKKVNADDCGHFRCNDQTYWCCKYCRKGE